MGLYLFTLLLLLVPVIYAEIDVSIVASGDPSQAKYESNGQNVDIISDVERATFDLEDASLKAAAGKYFGKVPDDAFLHKPTPWGDLYTVYGWQEVSRYLEVVNVEILDSKTEPIVILQQEFTNNGSKPSSFLGHIQQSVTNTISSSWDKVGELTVSENINYDINFLLGASGTSVDFKYSSKWGKGVSFTENLIAGERDSISFTVEPNQTLLVELQLMKCDMKVEVQYAASLSGLTAVNYSTPYLGHHFWAFNINTVMDAAMLKKTRESSEAIDLGFYSDSVIIVKDAASGKILRQIPTSIFKNDYE